MELESHEGCPCGVGAGIYIHTIPGEFVEGLTCLSFFVGGCLTRAGGGICLRAWMELGDQEAIILYKTGGGIVILLKNRYRLLEEEKNSA